MASDLDRPALPFDLCGGHPVLDFINTLDRRFEATGPEERLADYTDLLRFAEESRLLDAERVRRLAKSASPSAAARVMRAARELREALAAVLYGQLQGQAPARADVLTLERRFHEAGQHQELHWQAPSAAPPRLHWRWGRSAEAPDLPLWVLTQAAAELLASNAVERVRACGAEKCRWLFLDTSKNHTRRWCNMKVCGNRAKARRFHERHAE